MKSENRIEDKVLTESLIETINPNQIVYAEYSDLGAMGIPGNLMMYVLEQNDFNLYKTTAQKDVDTYNFGADFLIKHSNKKSIFLPKAEGIFLNYFYGGVGNNVFINNSSKLEIIDSSFSFSQNGKEYSIYSSVFGVFRTVSNSLSHKIE